MKNNKDAAKETAKTQPQTAAPAPVPNGKAKAAAPTAAPAGKGKAKKEPVAKVEKEEEPADRLPTTVAELKESKSGLVTFLHLSGKDKDDIAKELAATFKLADAQAVKIVRRITGRARFFRRAFDLMAAK
ncbi:MAG: hypothetical protein M5U12_12395 [Verrucomicrobia bacterium]|nr:hypothetical protein [Verrucomicrobiales bacterium]MCZ7636754.1 hypothetical protein [Verrucomicrobiota bacterium]